MDEGTRRRGEGENKETRRRGDQETRRRDKVSGQNGGLLKAYLR